MAAPATAAIALGGAVGIGAAAGGGGRSSVVAVGPGAGGIACHFWRNIPKDNVREVGSTLDQGESGLIVVAVNKMGSDIGGTWYFGGV